MVCWSSSTFNCSCDIAEIHRWRARAQPDCSRPTMMTPTDLKHQHRGKQPARSPETAGLTGARNKKPEGNSAAGARCYLRVFPGSSQVHSRTSRSVQCRLSLEQQMLPTAEMLQALQTNKCPLTWPRAPADPHHPGPAQGGHWRGTTDQAAMHENRHDFLLESNSE